MVELAQQLVIFMDSVLIAATALLGFVVGACIMLLLFHLNKR